MESESEREDDPIQHLQRQVASVIHKHNIPYKGNFLTQRNTRLRCRIRDPLSVEQVCDFIHARKNHKFKTLIIFHFQILMNEELVL